MSFIGYCIIFCIHLLAPVHLYSADLDSVEPLEPDVAEASDEASIARDALTIPEGWEVGVFAAEPLVANIVAFDIDHQGRIFVCESFRQNRGVTDNRAHDQKWLLADLSAKTVQDRIDYHKRLLGEAAITYAQHDDRIRRLEDSDHDGKADDSVIVADGFNHLEEGTGAGILVRGNEILYTCIPKLWKIVDENGDGKSESREAMSDGYGVRVAFRGHDLHGLILGPDGRVYFSIGDRGYHITTADGRILADPESGAVFRCEQDGSNLQVFATGLRNPQELAFNDVGDLFSVDNNSDSGDKARIIQILQEGDTGWRMHYQYLPDRGPFNREKIWEPLHESQPAYIVPPIANFTDGPSGLAFYPGTGFGDQLKNRFLICDFRGGPSNSGIRSFELTPSGATYSFATDDQPIWNCLPTDVAFGPDGALYFSDWVDGWNGLGKGRVFRITDPNHIDSPVVAEVKSILSRSWTDRKSDELTPLLSHQDRRVRLEAQWELARRGELIPLQSVVTNEDSKGRSRLHAVWAIGQLLRGTEESASILSVLRKLISDSDADVASAAIEILGDAGDKASSKGLLAVIANADTPDRKRYHAIRAFGKLRDPAAIDLVVKILDLNNNADFAIRHAGITYLAVAAKSSKLVELSKHPSVDVRRAAVVALRRQKSADIRVFLADRDPLVVSEAARAIHDESIRAAMPALSELISRPIQDKDLILRILNANYRLGGPENAKAIAVFATGGDHETDIRIEALSMLAEWASSDPRDRVLGRFDPLAERNIQVAADALEPQIELLMTAPTDIRSKAIEVAADLGIKKISGELIKELGDKLKSPQSKAVSLRALAKLNANAAVKYAKSVGLDDSKSLVLSALAVLSRHDPQASFDKFEQATKSGVPSIRQYGWDIMAKIDSPKSDAVIASGVKGFIDGQLANDVQLNVVEAADGRIDDNQKKQLDDHLAKLASDDPLGKWLVSLSGGDVENGKELFFEKTELSCVRCHKVDRAGGEVGPNLTTIGKEKDARYLLESICIPDAQIAKGFETARILDIDGNTYVGIVKSETDQHVELVLNDGSVKRIFQEDIEARRKGNSSMPADLTKYMTARELRDLVAYLASLKVDPRAEEDVE